MGSIKSKNGIFFEVTEVQKRKIKKNAALCGMRQGEYILRRALGYEPKAVQPDAFYHFHKDLCDLLNKERNRQISQRLEADLKTCENIQVNKL